MDQTSSAMRSQSFPYLDCLETSHASLTTELVITFFVLVLLHIFAEHGGLVMGGKPFIDTMNNQLKKEREH